MIPNCTLVANYNFCSTGSSDVSAKQECHVRHSYIQVLLHIKQLCIFWIKYQHKNIRLLSSNILKFTSKRNYS